jgi:mRNA interferase MazF
MKLAKESGGEEGAKLPKAKAKAYKAKGFGEWSKVKEKLDGRAKSKQFKVREVWWCSIGANVGHEEDGKHERFERPVLVFKKYNKDLFFGIPSSAKKKTGEFYHKIKSSDEKINEKTLLLSQGRTLSAKRLHRKLGKITEEDFLEIQKKHIKLLHPIAQSKGLLNEKPFCPPKGNFTTAGQSTN